MNVFEQSRQIIELLKPRLEADGYTVYLHPPRKLLPPFMGSYKPDAIALGPRKKIAIEVIVEGEPAKEKEQNLKQLFEKSGEWELSVYYARPSAPLNKVAAASRSAIEDSIRSVEQLVSEGRLAPALLTAWGTFEALGRVLLPEKLAFPQSPARLVEVLATSGHVTPSEADVLRTIANRRNEAAHGALEMEVSPAELRDCVAILGELRAQAFERVE